jgi:hypothetical protein
MTSIWRTFENAACSTLAELPAAPCAHSYEEEHMRRREEEDTCHMRRRNSCRVACRSLRTFTSMPLRRI